MRTRDHGAFEPRHRAGLAAAAALLASCASSSDPCSGDPERDLAHRDWQCIIQATFDVEREGRLDLFPLLLRNLRHEDPVVRMITGVAVRRLSGVDFGYNFSAGAGEREEAILRWEIWWRERRGATAPGGGSLEVTAP